MAQLLECLDNTGAPEGLQQPVLALKANWARLAELVEQPAFAGEYKLCGDFELSMVDPDDVLNLRIGHEVGCCLAPDGHYHDQMLARLAGGWVLWTVKNMQGDTIAIAWAAPNKQGDLVIDFADERVNFRGPPRGNDLIEHLYRFAVPVADHINARSVWLTPQHYGRLENFEALERTRTARPRTFDKGTPYFGSESDEEYVDSFGKPQKYGDLRQTA
jgi:hypothetical protein